jgi:hypothetical protein
MAKILTVRLKEKEYDQIEKLAKIAGKNTSQFVREKLKESIQQEMRETTLLERLIRMIESLQNFQPQNTAQRDSEILREIYKLLIYLAWHEKTVAELTIIMEQKRKEYMQKRQEIEQKLGLEF